MWELTIQFAVSWFLTVFAHGTAENKKKVGLERSAWNFHSEAVRISNQNKKVAKNWTLKIKIN